MPYKDKEKQKEYFKKYNFKRRNKQKIYIKKWSLKNKEKLKKYLKEYLLLHKDKIKKYKKKYNLKNKLKQKKYMKEWVEKNRELLNEKRRIKTKKDPKFKLSIILRSRILKALKGVKKNESSLKLLGVKDVKEVWDHLEKSFKPGMTRKNHGKWHIDHIKPCASFDLTKASEQRKCFHYTNLQPLWASENLSKGNRIS